MKQWTPQQHEAITARDTQVLVSAAAGSGKTAVLVERIIGIITSAENPVDIDQLLVVTFTEAAAAEMLHRLTHALGTKVGERPTDSNLRRQLFLLGRANITTIHSFCLRVVRSAFHLLDIDPGFKIADTTEITLLKDQVIDDLFEEWYKNQPLFLPLVEMYGDKYSDEGLKTTVLELNEFSLGDPNPREWLQKHASVFSIEDIEQTPWYSLIADYLRRALSEVVFVCNKALELCNAPEGPQKYIAALQSDKDIAQKSLDALSRNQLEQVNSILQEPLMRFAAISSKDNVDPLLKELVKNIRDKEIKKRLKTLRDDIFSKPIKEMAQDVNMLSPIISTLVQLTLSFQEDFAKAKQQKNIMDFNDLEHFAIAALHHKEVRDNFTFRQVLIDEYQDSNYIQEFILNAVGHTRFMVGDIKQSIYKFRGAVPELFLSKMKSSGEPLTRLISLSKNFRSNKSVIDAINFLFEKLMPPTGITYDDDAKLHHGAAENGDDIKAEIHIINTEKDKLKAVEEQETGSDETVRELTNMELEAAIIAKRIKELIPNVQYSDIAILTRTVAGVSDTLAVALSAQGIPSRGESTAGFFDTAEIMTLVSLLNIIDNPLQDIHILTVLKSPLYNIDVNDLVRIRQLSGGLFFSCIQGYLADPEQHNAVLQQFMDDLTYFRNLAKHTPIDQLLLKILTKTSYHHHVEQANGSEALSNIYMLVEIAAKQQSKSLYHFTQHIGLLMRRNVTIGEAKTGAVQNAVTIMSIHKSKGLEYPVVFVVGMGRRFNFRDKQRDLTLHRQYGFGPKFIDIENRIKYPTIASIAISNAIHAESLAEEIRILYVAATRAKHRLIMIGTLANTKASEMKWQSSLSPLSSSTFFDMIMPIITDQEGSPFEIFNHRVEHSGSSSVLLTEDELLEHKSLINEKQVQDHGLIGAAGQNHATETVPIPQLPTLPTSINISEIKGNYYKQLAYDRNETPSWEGNLSEGKRSNPLHAKSGKSPFSPAELGNIHHTVMEHLNLGDNITTLLDRLLQKNLLTEQERSAINVSWIQKFLISPLAQRMSRSPYIKKETHFAMNISPQEAYLQGEGSIVVHGIIDAYFEEADGLILVDYKTDRIDRNINMVIEERYKIQMQIYKKALENITSKPVTQSIIYLLPTGEEVLI